MVNALQVKNTIETKVFTGLGSTAGLERKNSTSFNDYGEATITYVASTNIVVVPWYWVFGRQSYEMFGNLEKGEMDLAIKADQEIGIDDKLTFNTKVYKVKAVEHYILKDTILVKVVRLSEAL